MPVIAVTGGVATGKSTFVEALRPLVDAVISSDVIAREVVQPFGECYQAVVDRFGRSIVMPSGEIDRQSLRKLVFEDKSERLALEAIVHPAILAETRRQIEKIRLAKPNSLIVVEVPLLYELGLQGEYDIIVVVACSQDDQVSRLREREHLDHRSALMIIGAQLPLQQKVDAADVVVWNSGNYDQLNRAAIKLVKDVVSRTIHETRMS